MKRRWRWQWDAEILWGIAFVWLISGVVAVFVLAATDSHDGHMAASAPDWFLPIWLGPFALVALGFALVGLCRAAKWAVRNPPVRRVTESSPDIRKVYRAEEADDE